MYSVLRFRNLPDDETIARIGQLANETIPGLYDGPDREEGRISVSLADNDDWAVHTAGLQDRLQALAAVILAAKAAGATLEIDIAIWDKDYYVRWLTEYTVGTSLLRILAADEIELCISIYGVKRR